MRTTKTADEIKAIIRQKVNGLISTPLTDFEVKILASAGLDAANWDAGSPAMFQSFGVSDARVIRHEIELLKQRYDVVL